MSVSDCVFVMFEFLCLFASTPGVGYAGWVSVCVSVLSLSVLASTDSCVVESVVVGDAFVCSMLSLELETCVVLFGVVTATAIYDYVSDPSSVVEVSLRGCVVHAGTTGSVLKCVVPVCYVCV